MRNEELSMTVHIKVTFDLSSTRKTIFKNFAKGVSERSSLLFVITYVT